MKILKSIKNLLLTIFCVSYAVHTFSQGSIVGTVVDQKDLPLPGATIILTTQGDSIRKQYSISGTSGEFYIDKLQDGHYLLSVSYVSFENLDTPVNVSGSNAINVKLQMKQISNSLGPVTIQGKRNAIQVTSGKASLNVESSPLAQNRSAFDLLKSIPGVQVSKDGEISIKGKSGVVVLMDGEPVELGAKELRNLLKSTPGATLKTIDVLNSPPASMDASGNAGVINLIFAKKEKRGLNGGITSGIGSGRYVKTDHSLNLSYGNEKWDANFLYSFDYDHIWQRDSLFSVRLEPSGETRLSQRQINPNKSNSHLLKVGLDRVLNDKHSIGIKLSLSENRGATLGNTFTRLYATSGPGSELSQVNNLHTQLLNLDGVLRYKYKISSKQTFRASAQGIHNKSSDNDRFTISQRKSSDTHQSDLIQRNFYPSRIKSSVLKADYELITTDSTKFETGLRSSFTSMHSSQTRENFYAQDWLIDTLRSNRFGYNEMIHAAYASMSTKKGNWSVTAGLRGEYSHIKGQSEKGQDIAQQKYLSIFPNIQVGYRFGDSYQLSLGYNRRIDRPEYDNLNPSIRYVDQFTVSRGNPNLKPQFSNNIELNQQFLGFIDLSIGYSNITNPINMTIIRSTGLNSYTTTINSKSQNQWNASLSFPITAFKWWENYQTFYAYTSQFNADLEGRSIAERGKSFGFQSFNSFILPSNINLELTAWYQSRGIFGNFRNDPMAEINLGVSKSFLSKALTVGVSVSDLFYTSIFKGDILTGYKANESFKLDSRFDSRIFKVSLNWKFGKQSRYSKNTYAEDTEKRMPESRKGNLGKPAKDI